MSKSLFLLALLFLPLPPQDKQPNHYEVVLVDGSTTIVEADDCQLWSEESRNEIVFYAYCRNYWSGEKPGEVVYKALALSVKLLPKE